MPHTFLRLGRPAPKFRQTCTATQKQLIFRGFKCDFWIPCAKNPACTIFFKILASLEVILCTKNIIFCHDFTVFHDIHEILKIQYFGIYQQLGKVWRKSDRYEWHFQFFLDNVIWNYPYINQFKNLDKIKCLKIQTGINY